MPLRCFACETREIAQRRFAKDGDTAGIYFALKEIPRSVGDHG